MTQNIDLTAMQTSDSAGKRNCESLKREGVVREYSGTEMVVKLLFTWTN